MNRLPLFLLSFLLFPLTSIAHGPTPQKGLESITIHVSVDTVWNLIKQFDAIAGWHPDVKASSGDGQNAADGIRTLTLQNGGQLVESLDYYSDKDHEYSYRLKTENVTAFPFSSYTTKIQVMAGKDAAAVKAMDMFFKNGLLGLKQKLEK